MGDVETSGMGMIDAAAQRRVIASGCQHDGVRGTLRVWPPRTTEARPAGARACAATYDVARSRTNSCPGESEGTRPSGEDHIADRGTVR